MDADVEFVLYMLMMLAIGLGLAGLLVVLLYFI